jgi:transcriptional regulator with XRE-family HTH domain
MERKGVDAQFGERVKAERKRCRWTQPELAKMLKDKGIQPMGPVTISKIESGDRPARLTEALRLAECFGVSVDALLGRTTDRRDDHAYALRAMGDVARRSAVQLHDINATLCERLEELAPFGSEDLQASVRDACGGLHTAYKALESIDVAHEIARLLLPEESA